MREKRILTGNEREYALQGYIVRDIAGMNRTERRQADRIRHARTLRLHKAVDSRFKTIDKTPFSGRLTPSARHYNDCDDSIQFQYRKDRIILDKMCTARH